ncbi:MAG: pyridoxamine 5'-phosphate oxidase family protein [Eggerthellaceae bacterium]|nr:pyridoxamine 5'-phosphate oxidase family protein [Eggerthellaceae bacterium]
MFREMRRIKQQLSEEEARQVLERGRWGTLAVLGDDAYPYTVPLNYAFFNDAIYFHCAKEGHKLDALANSNKISFCVVERDTVVPQEFTSYYKSVVVFGRAHIVEDEAEKQESLYVLGMRYNPNRDATHAEMSKAGGHLHMVRIDIEHLSGKQAKELVGKE